MPPVESWQIWPFFLVRRHITELRRSIADRFNYPIRLQKLEKVTLKVENDVLSELNAGELIVKTTRDPP